MARPRSQSRILRTKWSRLSVGRKIILSAYGFVVAVSAGIVLNYVNAPSGAYAAPVTERGVANHVVYYRGVESRMRLGVNDQRPAWRKYAAVTPQTLAGRPMIAIVIDDMGPNQKNARRAMTMPAPLTLSFLPYADKLTPMVTRARANGHEILLHLPMEPTNGHVHNPGPNSLLTGLSASELKRRLAWNLDRFKGYVGINNHMGSRFMENPGALKPVMSELKARGMLFLDSRTTMQSVGRRLALQAGVPYGSRDIFLDNERSAERVARQLRRVENAARKNGAAIAIGHPHTETLDVLERWIGDLEHRGFELVPVSAIVARSIHTAANEKTRLEIRFARNQNE